MMNRFKYLNITKTEEEWGIYVNSIGYSKVEPREQYPKEKHPNSHHLTWNRGRTLHDYYIVFITRGKGLFASSLSPEAIIKEGSCFFLHPGVQHRYKPDPYSGWEEYWVGFNGYFAKQLMSKGIFCPEEPILLTGHHVEILSLFKGMLESVQEALPGYPQQIAGSTLQVLGHLQTVTNHLEYSIDPIGKLIIKAKFILQQSFETSVDMQDLASQLPMGYSSFRKAFKTYTGESPNQYHLNLRLNRARDLLSSTILNINEIAMQTGFESLFYFSKLFKKKHGISPRSYRMKTIKQANYIEP